ncbi:MAG: glycosyltransferase family 2 protein [Candidatus ainarchaeum sp.]|nr:glycosyltransferase family 2 protein [Candidatus ainarchaeum sp.]
MKPEEITIVVPCRNEADTLLPLYKELKSRTYKVLVPIAKSSSDGTRELCEKNAIPHFMDSGSGKGAGLRESLAHISTPYLVFMDADGSHDLNDIPEMAKKLVSADLVIGSRLQGGSMELYDGSFGSFLRSFFTICINQIVNSRFNSRITDTQNGFRAARTESLKKLNLTGNTFEIETEMVMKALKKGMKIEEVASREYPRKFGGSGVSLVRHGWRYLLCVLSNLF